MNLFLVFFNLQLSIYLVLRFIYDMELMCKTFFYDGIQSLPLFVCGYVRVSWFQTFNELLINDEQKISSAPLKL